MRRSISVACPSTLRFTTGEPAEQASQVVNRFEAANANKVRLAVIPMVLAVVLESFQLVSEPLASVGMALKA